jgi:hypothetical protein
VTWAWGKGTLQVPRLPPDFLSGLVASVKPRAAFLKESRIRGRWLVQRVGNPEFVRDDKVEGGDFYGKSLLGWGEPLEFSARRHLEIVDGPVGLVDRAIRVGVGVGIGVGDGDAPKGLPCLDTGQRAAF